MEIDQMQRKFARDFSDKVREFLSSQDDYGIMRVDLGDIMEANSWLLRSLEEFSQTSSTIEQIEEFLIQLDVNYVEHVAFHLDSLRDNLRRTLDKISILQSPSRK